MAAFVAAQNGNWNASATWGKAGSPPVEGTDYPGPDDTVDLGAYVVTVNQTLVPSSGNPIGAISTTGAGQLLFNAAGTLHTFSAVSIQAGTKTTGVVYVTGSASLALYANVTGGTAATGYGVSANTSGTVTINGNITGGSHATAYGLLCSGNSTVNVNGDVAGGVSSVGLYNSSATALVTITGNVSAGSASSGFGARNNSTGTITKSANTTHGLYNYSTGTINITGNVTGGSGSGGNPANGVYNYSTGAVNIIGNVTGGTYSLAMGVHNVSTGVVTITGNLIYSATSAPYTGGAPVLTAGSQYYIQCGSVNRKYPQQLTAGQFLEGISHGGLSGTYHVAAVGEVKNGVTFGASQAETGTYSPGGTYAEGQAAQLVTDKAAVEAEEDSILDSATILTIPGIYHAPSASEVWHTAVFGPDSETEGTMVGSDIANCEAANIKAGVTIDDVTGTLPVSLAFKESAI